MTRDAERREVARRLREIRPCKSGHIMWWEIAKALGLKQPAGWFGWEKFEPDSANRLADLIEPGEPKVRCVAEVKVDGERLEKLVHDAVVEATGIDRDALLALADEMDDTSCDKRGELSVSLGDIWGWSEAIYEALGVQDA